MNIKKNRFPSRDSTVLELLWTSHWDNKCSNLSRRNNFNSLKNRTNFSTLLRELALFPADPTESVKSSKGIVVIASRKNHPVR